MPYKIDDKTLTLLNRVLRAYGPVAHPVEPKGHFPENITKLDLPTAPGAEYFFRLWFYESGEREISACLIQNPSDGTHFWYRPLEMGEFNGCVDDLVTEFCEEVEALLTHETRIFQQKGWLFWHFRCEFHTGKKWKSIYRHSAFRGGGFKIPQIEGRRRVYHSAPIASVAATD